MESTLVEIMPGVQTESNLKARNCMKTRETYV